MLSFHINTFFIVNEMCLPISVQDRVTLESRWSCTDLLDTLILNYAIKSSTFTFCPETLVPIGGSQGEGW